MNNWFRDLGKAKQFVDVPAPPDRVVYLDLWPFPPEPDMGVSLRRFKEARTTFYEIGQIVGGMDVTREEGDPAPFIAGGAIFRALSHPTGDFDSNGDVDVFVPCERNETEDEVLARYGEKFEGAGFEYQKEASTASSWGLRGIYRRASDNLTVDLVPTSGELRYAKNTIARFDLTTVMYATDGKNILSTGIRNYHRTNRPTTGDRLRKYIMRGIRFNLSPVVIDRILDFANDSEGIAGVLLPRNADNDSVFGLKGKVTAIVDDCRYEKFIL